jgi:hypothetical protein
MRSIYHLGLHKTGSTSLQKYLARNQQALARSGILFPPVTPEGLAQFQADAGAQAARREPAIADYMAHNALAYRMIAEGVRGFVFPPIHAPMPDADSAMTQIAEQARTIAPTALVFCSEDLARASLMVPDVPARFARCFGRQNVTLMANLRRPDAAIAAWQTQRLRFGLPFGPLHADPPEAWLGTVHFEYRAALEPWLRAFPRADLQIQPYDRLRAQGGSVKGFCATSGLALPQGLAAGPDANPGLPHALLEVARQSLAALPRERARLFRTYLAQAAPRLTLPANDKIELFAPATRTALHRAFVDIHDWLSQITGTWPFFADLDTMQTRPPLHVTEATRQTLPALLHDAHSHNAPPDHLEFLKNMAAQA